MYICDVCGLRFQVAGKTAEEAREILCPRCRTPFVRPAVQKRKPNSRGVPRCMAFS
jgi:DNA-directed RNA polymerase subunit RPC12/RpoP